MNCIQNNKKYMLTVVCITVTLLCVPTPTSCWSAATIAHQAKRPVTYVWRATRTLFEKFLHRNPVIHMPIVKLGWQQCLKKNAPYIATGAAAITGVGIIGKLWINLRRTTQNLHMTAQQLRTSRTDHGRTTENLDQARAAEAGLAEQAQANEQALTQAQEERSAAANTEHERAQAGQAQANEQALAQVRADHARATAALEAQLAAARAAQEAHAQELARINANDQPARVQEQQIARIGELEQAKQQLEEHITVLQSNLAVQIRHAEQVVATVAAQANEQRSPHVHAKPQRTPDRQAQDKEKRFTLISAARSAPHAADKRAQQEQLANARYELDQRAEAIFGQNVQQFEQRFAQRLEDKEGALRNTIEAIRKLRLENQRLRDMPEIKTYVDMITHSMPENAYEETFLRAEQKHFANAKKIQQLQEELAALHKAQPVPALG